MHHRLPLAALLLAAALPALPALATSPKPEERAVERYYFTGKLDEKYAIQMDIGRDPNGTEWTGSYFYVNPNSTGEGIQLTGMMDDGGKFQFSEFTEKDDKRNITGNFGGSFTTDRTQAQGTWNSADGKRHLPFTLEQVAGYRQRSNSKRIHTKLEGEESCPCYEPVEKEEKSCTCEAKSQVTFPVLPGKRGDALLALLTRENLLDVAIGTKEGEEPQEGDSDQQDWDAVIAIGHYAPPLLVLETNSYLYPWGAAHGMPGVSGLNLLEEQGALRKLELKDVVSGDDRCLGKINGVLKEALRKLDAPAVTEPEAWQADLTQLYTRDFLIQPGALTFLFPPYDVGPYAAGTLRANVPYRAIADCIPASSPIAGLKPATKPVEGKAAPVEGKPQWKKF